MASEKEIIEALKAANGPEVQVRILDQLGHKIRPQHRKLIQHLVELSQSEQDEQVAYAVRRALFQIRSRYNITNFALFLMDPLTLLQSSDPAYRLKAVETLESTAPSLEQAYYFLGSLQFEEDPFVLRKMIRAIPHLRTYLDLKRLKSVLKSFQEHTDPKVRQAVSEAFSTLGQTDAPEEIRLLWPTLDDEDQRVRQHAIQRLLELPRSELIPVLQDHLRTSESLNELESMLELVEEGAVAFEEELITTAKERLNQAKRKQENTLRQQKVKPLSGKAPESLSLKKGLILLGGALILGLLLGRLSKPSQTVAKPLIAEEIQKDEQVSEEKVPEAPPPPKVLASLKEKTELFRKQGQILRENAEAFFQQAGKAYDEENYQEAIDLYMALYDVYKDNRLAVDAVRQLSRTQTVQNKLESVKEYTSKKQFISAVKKLEEIKHLISAENWRQHFEAVESERKAHQEGSGQ